MSAGCAHTRTSYRRISQQHARRASDHPQHGSLCDQLPNQPATAGAKRRPHRQLSAPRRAARQQQARDIDAGDQQHQRDRAEQNEQGRASLADQQVEHRRRAEGEALVGVGKRLLKVLADAPEVGVDRVFGHTGSRARDDAQEFAPPAPCRLRAEGLAVLERRVHVDGLGQARVGRQHTHDQVRLAADGEGPAHDGGIGPKLAHPETVVEQRHAGSAWQMLVGGKRPPDDGLEAEHVDEPPAHPSATNLARVAETGEREDSARVGLDLLEALRQRLQAHEVRGGHRVRRAVRIHRAQTIEAVGVAIWQAVEQHRVDDAEHGAGRANADGERQHGNGGKSRAVPERAHRIRDIVYELPDPLAAGHRLLPSPADSHARRARALELAEALARQLGGPCTVFASRDEFVDAHGEMKIQFVVYVALRVGPEQLAEARPARHGRQLRSSAGASRAANTAAA